MHGAIPCYTGFHPHLLHYKNLYASCNIDNNNNLIEIKEKFSFKKNKMEAYHSSGTYYFKNGRILKKYYQEQINQGIMYQDEYYSSLTYNLLCQDSLKTYIYDKINYFCQWGAPKDLEEYLFWMNQIRKW